MTGEAGRGWGLGGGLKGTDLRLQHGYLFLPQKQHSLNNQELCGQIQQTVDRLGGVFGASTLTESCS